MGSGDRVIRAALVVLTCALALAATAGTTGGPQAAVAAPRLAAARPVVFVALGSFPRADANALARHVGTRLGLRTRVAGSKVIPRSMLDRARKQYKAQQLITLLSRPATSQDVVIGLTAEDMYSTSETFRFVFSLRDPNGFAVVSRARMDPRALGLTPDPALRMRRLQKMVLKNVAALALGRSPSGNPRSVMFDTILSVDDLDYMTQEVRPPAPSRARRGWLAQSTRVCKLATSREKALISRSQIATPDAFVTFLREYADLRGRHRSELAAVPPAPEDRASNRALLARFGRGVSADRAALSRLEAGWSEQVANDWVQARARLAYALKAGALELGSVACGRYFDPATYSG
jgi:predicted Zn-dependent protease